MTSNSRRGLSLIGVISASLFLSFACATVEGEPCYDDGTCDGDFDCVSDECVATEDPGPTSDPQPSFEACRTCGDAACVSAVSACDGSAGCRALADCSLACGGDATCLSACDDSGASADAAQLSAEETACVVAACPTECVFDPPNTDSGTGGGSGTGGSNWGEPCTSEDDKIASCTSGDSQVCVGGIWEQCAACAIVEPQSSCGYFSAFVLDKLLRKVPGAVTAYENTETGVKATFSFSTSGESGYIQLRMAQAAYPTGVTINVSTSQDTVSTTQETAFAALETADSASGCLYEIIGGRLTPFDPEACWPEVSDYSPLSGEHGVDLLSVRYLATEANSVTMTVTGITLQ